MDIADVCCQYFTIQEPSNQTSKHLTSSSLVKNTVTALKILSYFTVIIPMAFGITYASALLFDRIKLNTDLNSDSIHHVATQSGIIKNPSALKELDPTEKNQPSSDLRSDSSHYVAIQSEIIEDKSTFQELDPTEKSQLISKKLD